MLRKIIFFIFKYIWFVISFLERCYWYLWRTNEKQKFHHCGKDVYIGRNCNFINQSVSIGKDVYIGRGCNFQATNSHIFIGDHVMFGPEVHIHGGDHRTDLIGRTMKSIGLDEKAAFNDADIIIENDVWIGARAIILKGVTIGEGAIVGAGAVIIEDVEPYTICVGSKPQKVFSRFSEEDLSKHKKMLNV